MLRLKCSTGVNWCEALPDDLDNPGGWLKDMSPDDCRSFLLSRSSLKISQLSGMIVLHLGYFASNGKSPFKYS